MDRPHDNPLIGHGIFAGTISLVRVFVIVAIFVAALINLAAAAPWEQINRFAIEMSPMASTIVASAMGIIAAIVAKSLRIL